MNAFNKALVASLVSSASLSAASVAVNNGGDLNTLTAIASNNSTLASGGIVAAGYFQTLSDTQVLALSTDIANIAALIADFSIVGTTTLDSAVAGAGVYSGDFVNISLPNATRVGTNLYTFLGNQATLVDSTQWLLYQHDDIIDAQDTVSNPDSNALVLGQDGVALISGGTFTSSIDFDGSGSNPSVPVNAIRLAVVPEPSAFLLSAFGGLALLRRKR